MMAHSNTLCWGVARGLAGAGASLLLQHGVVALEGLEDVVVGPKHAQAVDGGVAVSPARLSTHRQRIGCVPCRVCLEPCPARPQPLQQQTINRCLGLQRWHSQGGRCEEVVFTIHEGDVGVREARLQLLQ